MDEQLKCKREWTETDAVETLTNYENKTKTSFNQQVDRTLIIIHECSCITV